MDLTKAVLPDSVVVSGRSYKIHTGHPYWFRFFQILEQEKKYLTDFDFLYVDTQEERTITTSVQKRGFINRLLRKKLEVKKSYTVGDYIPQDRQAGVEALAAFFYEKRELPRVDGEGGPNVLDYTIDADLIYAGILQCYGIDLMEKQYHWHIVRALIGGLEGTKLNTIIGYRGSKPGKNRELERMKAMWELPPKVDPVDSETVEKMSEVFYGAQFGA